MVDFAKEALFAETPLILEQDARFYESKEASSERRATSGIRGLSYSVIRNALYKVHKLRNPDEAGERVVVQGGNILK